MEVDVRPSPDISINVLSSTHGTVCLLCTFRCAYHRALLQVRDRTFAITDPLSPLQGNSPIMEITETASIKAFLFFMDISVFRKEFSVLGKLFLLRFSSRSKKLAGGLLTFM